MQPLVGVIMGSQSDWETMRHAVETLERLDVPHEHRVVSAHRTPDLLFEYASSAEERGLQVLIAGAGGAAHLPGMAAAKTTLPVLGVPVESKTLKGMDSLLSIVQMPAGVPVGTLAIGRAGAVNAALLAAAIVARFDEGVRERLGRFRAEQTESVLAAADPSTYGLSFTVVVGVIGGGQLGRMLGLAGIPLGLSFRFLDPAPDAPAGAVGELLVGAYDDVDLLARLADGADVVTYEFENVPVEAARRVGAVPGPAALEAAQDRLAEKRLFRRLGIPTARIDDEVEAFPALLKTRRLGYDGKGQHLVDERPGPNPDHVLEELVAFDRELSLIAVRAPDGETRFYPLVENVHEDGILRSSRAPAVDAPQALAEDYAGRVLEELDYVGVLALELFEADGDLLANELAPRVHNTGHWTIEGAVTSQFENHLRAVLGLPLGPTDLSGEAAMANLIGTLPPPEAVLAIPGAHLHLYGKEPRPGRKLGHVTLLDPTPERELALAEVVGTLPARPV